MLKKSWNYKSIHASESLFDFALGPLSGSRSISIQWNKQKFQENKRKPIFSLVGIKMYRSNLIFINSMGRHTNSYVLMTLASLCKLQDLTHHEVSTLWTFTIRFFQQVWWCIPTTMSSPLRGGMKQMALLDWNYTISMHSQCDFEKPKWRGRISKIFPLMLPSSTTKFCFYFPQLHTKINIFLCGFHYKNV